MMKLNLQVEEKLRIGAERLLPLIGAEHAEDGLAVKAVCGERIGAELRDGEGIIYYKEVHHFFRELGVFVQYAKKETDFSVAEDDFFDTIGAMIDSARCAVPTVTSVKKMLDHLALMGYDMVLMYTEDTTQLDKRPYFGYMRGRYTKAELREIDAYAWEYGIEVIPCLECYGHMGKYLIWPEAAPIKDTGNVLLAREEQTFAFLDELIGEISGCFRSKRIHIGMDEAWDMGRGAFLDKNGYVSPVEIFDEYMERVIAITNKYGLKPMMWSDMYFRVNSPSNGYYDKEIVIPEKTRNVIPKEIQLVFWHYGEKPWCDDYMLQKHMDLGRDVIFAGGLWSWIGHFPEHHYAFETTKYSLECCRKNGVKEMMTTVWLNDNAECDLFATLFGLSFSAELCYHADADEAFLRDRFEATTGGDYDAFYNMSKYHNRFEEGEEYENFHNRFLGKHLFWQDIMEGLYDTHLLERPMSGHYRACAAEMEKYEGKWSYLYDFAAKVFSYLALKTEIAEKLVPSYQAGDKGTLAQISNELLPRLKEATQSMHLAHRDMWFANNKIIGWSNMDIRYGGMACRCDTAKLLIDAYLSGETEYIEELEEKRLHKGLSGFQHYSNIVTPNIKV